ncbi:MAG: hypothetical protein EBS13_05865 [Verrucomicrobia bacterium]|nr:hypothetical protein [Verrucomicrobiota bacterium]
MKSSQNKPTLEDLFVSKKISSPRPESWSDFEKKVKIKTLESFHKKDSTRYVKYFLPVVVLLMVPVFIFNQDDLFTKKKLFVSTPNKTTSVLNETKLVTNDLSSDLSNSDIQFTYNTYSSTHSNDYEKSFALENMKASANISSYTTPTFLLDESNLKENFTNFSF